MFTHAITRPPAESYVDGITTAKLGQPDYALALRQHAAYVDALRACGLEVTVLEPAPAFPDSCFVEDTALLTGRVGLLRALGRTAAAGKRR